MEKSIDDYITQVLENADLEDAKESSSFRFTVTIPAEDAEKLDVLSKYLRFKRATFSSDAISLVLQGFEKRLHLTLQDYRDHFKKGPIEGPNSLTELQKSYFAIYANKEVDD